MSPLELGFLAGGVGTVVLALLWRALARRRARTVLRRALADPDPTGRRVAVQVAARQGLSRHAKVLLDLARREEDQAVLRALADEVVRNQWEPDDQRRLVELRLWACRHVEELRATEEAVPPATASPGAGADAQPDGPGAHNGPEAPGETVRARNGSAATVSSDADRVAAVLAGWSLLWSQGTPATRPARADPSAPATPPEVARTAPAADGAGRETGAGSPPKARRRRRPRVRRERPRWG